MYDVCLRHKIPLGGHLGATQPIEFFFPKAHFCFDRTSRCGWSNKRLRIQSTFKELTANVAVLHLKDKLAVLSLESFRYSTRFRPAGSQPGYPPKGGWTRCKARQQRPIPNPNTYSLSRCSACRGVGRKKDSSSSQAHLG